jgi:hypothetical protein
MKKRYIILFILFLLILSIALILYFVFLKKGKSKDKEEVKFYSIEKIFDKEVLYFEIRDDIMYGYLPEEGTYNKLSFKDNTIQPEALVSKIDNIGNISLAPNASAILYLNKKGRYVVYDFETKSKIELDEFLTGATWYPSDNDEKIIGSYSKSPHNNINLYKWKEEEREELHNLFAETGQFSSISPDSQKITYSIEEYDDTPAFGEEVPYEGPEPVSFFVAYDLANKKEIIRSYDIIGSKFNSNSMELLLSIKKIGQFDSLHLLNLKSEKDTPLFLQTYFHKTSFANDPNIIFYARVEGFKNEKTRDTLRKINIKTGEKVQLTRLESDISYDVSNIITSSDDKNIYFINKYDKKLHQVATE